MNIQQVALMMEKLLEMSEPEPVVRAFRNIVFPSNTMTEAINDTVPRYLQDLAAVLKPGENHEMVKEPTKDLGIEIRRLRHQLMDAYMEKEE